MAHGSNTIMAIHVVNSVPYISTLLSCLLQPFTTIHSVAVNVHQQPRWLADLG